MYPGPDRINHTSVNTHTTPQLKSPASRVVDTRDPGRAVWATRSVSAASSSPKAPERAPKSPSAFAGHFTLAAPAKAGAYRVTISSEGWVDVLDGGAYLHPIAFTGARDCEGARKSVKFDLPDRPLALQFSGVPKNQISVIVSAGQ